MTYPAFPEANKVPVFNDPFDPTFMTQAIQIIPLTGGSIPWLTTSEAELFTISADQSAPHIAVAYQTIPLKFGPAFGWCAVTQGGTTKVPFPPA